MAFVASFVSNLGLPIIVQILLGFLMLVGGGMAIIGLFALIGIELDTSSDEEE